MKNWQYKLSKTGSVFLLALLLLALPASAMAAPLGAPSKEDKVVIGGTYTLSSGNSLDGNLVVLTGVVTLEADSIVNGDVVVFGGTVSIEGSIQGNLVALGGVIDLEDTALVRGDMIAPSSVVSRSPEAQIEGQVITDGGLIWGEDIQFSGDMPVQPFGGVYSPLLKLLGVLFQSFFLSAIAVLVVVLAPKPIQRTRDASLVNPLVAGGLGLFTQVVFVATLIFLGLLSILIITIPFTLLGMFVTVLAFVIGMGMGWFAMGLEVGKRVQDALKQNWTPGLQAGLGTFIITFVVGSFGIFLWSFLGGMFTFAVASIGLGAVLLTRFGTRTYVPPVSVDDEDVEVALEETD